MVIKIIKLFRRYPKFLMVRSTNSLNRKRRYIIIINFKLSDITLITRIVIFCIPLSCNFFRIALI